jgi:hypothetical protein
MGTAIPQAPPKLDPKIKKAAKQTLSDVASATKMSGEEVTTWASRIALAKTDQEREDIVTQLEAKLKH